MIMPIMDIFQRLHGSGTPRGRLNWIIAGLGNPGLVYENTRHNAGFLALDTLAQEAGAKFDRTRFQSNCGEAMLGDMRCLLLKPATFMNRSGEAIQRAISFYKIPSERLLVIYDDIALPPGHVRIRPKGSAGGHNGMKSIIAALGTEQFPRIRIGIGDRPNPAYDLADWVLSKLTPADMEQLQGAFENAAAAARLIVQGDLNGAMNRYNK